MLVVADKTAQLSSILPLVKTYYGTACNMGSVLMPILHRFTGRRRKLDRYPIVRKQGVSSVTPAAFQLKVGQRPAGSFFARAGLAMESRDTGTGDAYTATTWHQTISAIGFVAFLGDSITQGFAATEPYSVKSYRSNFSTRSVHVNNLGINSARLAYAIDTTLDLNVARTTYISPVFNSLKGVFHRVRWHKRHVPGQQERIPIVHGSQGDYSGTQDISS